MADSSRILNFSVLQYLSRLSEKTGTNRADLQNALASLSTAFELNLSSAQHTAAYSLAPHNLEEIFAAGVDFLGAAPTGSADPGAEFKDNEMFQKFMTNITAKGFFRGVEEGSPEYAERYAKCVGKFKERLAAQGGAAPAAAAAAPAAAAAAAAPVAASAIDPAVAAQAEELKTEGNGHMTAKNFSAAISCYDAALQLVPAGPSSHIYLANRAAARCHLQQFERAEEDCERAVRLKPDYAKAHSRLGFARFHRNDFAGAAAAYEEALRLEPGNEQAQGFLDKARAQLRQGGGAVGSRAGGAGGAGGGGMPDLSSLMGMMGGMGGGGGGMPDIASMMRNPAMMQMAQQMMQNPQMRQMAQQMMSDPSAMANMMNMMGGGSGGGMDPAAMASMMNMMGGGQ